MSKKLKSLKSLASLKNSAKGSIDHVSIHPAKNSQGGQGFITHIHRNRPAAAQASMEKGGPYVQPPEPEETVHEDGNDMLSHVANTYGIKPENDGDADDEAPTAA